jgi:hypothetical protein
MMVSKLRRIDFECAILAIAGFALAAWPANSLIAGHQSQSEPDFKFVPSTEMRFAEANVAEGWPESVDQPLAEAKKNEAVERFWFRYGDASSRAVIIQFDPEDPTQLWVDTNRNKKFSAAESFTRKDDAGVWFLDLKAEHGERQRQTSSQQIRIRRDAESNKFHIATAGVRRGQADFNGQPRDALIEDRNGNGLWFDAEDRLFVDIDGNGKISRLRERLPCHGMRKIRGQLYAIAGNADGDSISLTPVTGSGKLIPMIQLADPSAKIKSISGQLGSATGIGIRIDTIDQPIEVPVGDWHVENLQIEAADENGTFHFVFAKSGSKKLVSIANGDEKEIELIGEMELSASVNVQREDSKTNLTIIPSLTTASGCYLVQSKTGKRSATSDNRLNAYSRDWQRDLEAGSSGFS